VSTAVIAAGHAVSVPDATVITMAVAIVVGIALAMFARDYIRFRAYAQHYAHELQREKWCDCGVCGLSLVRLSPHVARCLPTTGSWSRFPKERSVRWWSCMKSLVSQQRMPTK